MSDLLRAEDVSVRFGGLLALDAVSVRVEEGQIVGLIGPNGAGKTTLFNVISGLQPPTDGRVLFREQDVSRLPAHRRAALGIRRSFQNLGLMFDQSVETNVMAGQHLGVTYRSVDPLVRPWRWRREERAMAARVDDVLRAFDLERHRHRVVADLSFGVARFVELTASLVSEPALLLLDEPTTGLDAAESAHLADGLARVRDAGTTILVIAHDVGFVMRMCDWVYVLAGGSVIYEGRPDAVRDDAGVVEAYLGTAVHR